MNNETGTRMKTYEIEVDDAHKQEIISIGKQKIMKYQLNKHSLFDLFRSSIRFTRIHTWLIQFGLLILNIFLITKVINDEPFIYIIQSLTVTVVFSVIFFIDELFRSFTSGMWELEQTLKYDLRQHTIIKLLIFGITDLLLIIGLAIVSQGVIASSFWNIILYLLVPFNITCIVLFSLFTIWRNSLSSVVFWVSAGLILISIMLITNSINIYEVEMKYWGVGYIISIIPLLFIVMNMLNIKKWEAFC